MRVWCCCCCCSTGKRTITKLLDWLGPARSRVMQAAGARAAAGASSSKRVELWGSSGLGASSKAAHGEVALFHHLAFAGFGLGSPAAHTERQTPARAASSLTSWPGWRKTNRMVGAERLAERANKCQVGIWPARTRPSALALWRGRAGPVRRRDPIDGCWPDKWRPDRRR